MDSSKECLMMITRKKTNKIYMSKKFVLFLLCVLPFMYSVEESGVSTQKIAAVQA